jgi:hypothetical protein
MDQCVHAGMVAATFVQAKDESNFKLWKSRESSDCKRAGSSRYAAALERNYPDTAEPVGHVHLPALPIDADETVIGWHGGDNVSLDDALRYLAAVDVHVRRVPYRGMRVRPSIVIRCSPRARHRSSLRFAANNSWKSQKIFKPPIWILPDAWKSRTDCKPVEDG